MSDSLDRCFSEATINGLTLRNRLIKAATFEGKSPGGAPSDALVKFHERIGQGVAGDFRFVVVGLKELAVLSLSGCSAA